MLNSNYSKKMERDVFVEMYNNHSRENNKSGCWNKNIWRNDNLLS